MIHIFLFQDTLYLLIDKAKRTSSFWKIVNILFTFYPHGDWFYYIKKILSVNMHYFFII